MKFIEDLDIFLADFGVPCRTDSVQFTGLLDQPDEIMSLQRAGTVSRQYELTYRSEVTLARDQFIVVNEVPYQVREAPRQLDDGAFSRVLLFKNF